MKTILVDLNIILDYLDDRDGCEKTVIRLTYLFDDGTAAIEKAVSSALE